MSHISTIQVEIKDLAAVKSVCARMGWQFVEGQTTYQWFGQLVGDQTARLAALGMTAADTGKCVHAIKVPGCRYEIGVAPGAGGRGYRFAFDTYSDGGLHKVIGADGSKLAQLYAIEKVKIEARRKGYMVRETARQDGSIKLDITGV